MPYDNVISRTDAGALIPEDVAAAVLRGTVEQSAALSLFRRVPMSSATQRMPAIAALPTAYFVNGDTGLKQTTEAAWANKFLNVEEIAAIVPIPENVAEDLQFDVWDQVRPLLEEAVGRTLDAAIFFGVNKPASWPTDLGAAAIAAGNTRNRGVTAQAAGGIAEDFNLLFGTVEGDGYDVNGVVLPRQYRARLRGARDAQGVRFAEIGPNDVLGVTPRWAMRGLWPTGSGAVEALVGDFGEGIIGVRRDITWKLLDQAVITDNANNIIYNLPQQDMVALRVTARYAWQVANVINREQPVEASRYPFGVMRAP